MLAVFIAGPNAILNGLVETQPEEVEERDQLLETTSEGTRYPSLAISNT